ncbi:MAG: energy-coupling factor transporter transmembrane component T [Anaerolineae bacterium]|jgi:energy-coupling factor transport system permease protein
MMDLLLPGMYMSAESPLHRLDPRVKMGAAMLLMALPFAAPSLPSTVLLVGFVVAIALLSTAPVQSLVRTLGTVFWLGFFMFFFYLFTTPGRPLVSLWRIAVTWEGILAGAMQIYRLCLLVVVSALLTFTTSPAQLAHGLEAVLGPLARVGLPVRELAMVLTIALRFVPTLFNEIDKIVKAQRARGADLRSRSPWQRIRSWAPTFVPIFVSAFRRADDLARAMEARGFRGARHRTRLYQLRLTWQDLIASLVVILVSLAVIALERLV